MGRKSNQELQQQKLLDNSLLEKHLSNEFIMLTDEQKHEIALSLYQFTKLIYDAANQSKNE